MFDDQLPKTQGQVPGNLPIGEPEDMFSGVDKTPDISAPPSALDAGILRPVEKEEEVPISEPAVTENIPPVSKVEENLGIQNNTPVPPPSSAHSTDIYTIKEPSLTRGLVTVIIILVAVAILGSGGWWIYSSFIKTNSTDDLFVVPPIEEQLLDEEELFPEEEIVDNTNTVVPEILDEEVQSDLGQDIIDEQILFGEPIDKDGDGLDDQREIEIGTDPNNWDTDGDELSDGDEVIIWKTDPLNPDTDGDSFLDGAEIKSGYNPAGPGKLFEIPEESE